MRRQHMRVMLAGIFALAFFTIAFGTLDVAAGSELYTLDLGSDTIKRYDADSGDFLGYVASSNPAHNPMFLNPGTASNLLDIERAPDGTLYLLYDDGKGKIARYDANVGNPVDPLVEDPKGLWYAKYFYEPSGMVLGSDGIYICTRLWSVKAGITTTLRGRYLIMEHNLNDGTAAGRSVGAAPGSDDEQTGAMWMHATNVATVLRGSSDILIDTNENMLVPHGTGICRFNPDGEWYGPAGIGDTNAISAALAIQAPLDTVIDKQGRIYVCGDGGGVVGSGIERFNMDGSPAPAPGRSGAYFQGWNNYVESTPVFPQAMAISDDGKTFYVYSKGFSDKLTPAVKAYVIGGPNDGDFIKTIVEVSETIRALLFVPPPPLPTGTAIILR